MSPGEVYDPALGAQCATEANDRPEVRAWIRSLKRVLAKHPSGVWLYMQEDTLNIMALDPGGEVFRQRESGTCQSAIVGSIHIPGADAGAW